MSEVIDFKKKYKDLYLPNTVPSIIEVPKITFAAVDGKGNPNETDGEYKDALEVLYGIQYSIKMSKNGAAIPPGYYDYVVPPLEGLWWMSDDSVDFKEKSKYNWISMIRLPEYVNKDVFKWACNEAARKKKINTEKAYLFNFCEGLCVQCMHVGPYKNEPQTLALMEKYLAENFLKPDVNEKRRHHEIYLSNPQKTEPDKLKTVLRMPVRR